MRRGLRFPYFRSAFFKGSITIFISGFTMLMTQVVMLRELTSLYSVNELIAGVFLSFWMLFAGAGSYVARYFRVFSWNKSGFLPLAAGVMAWISLYVLYYVHAWIVPAGVVPGLPQWLILTALVTFLFCFPSGMMFTWFSAAISNQVKTRQTEKVYIAEQSGSLVAGILFYLVSSWWLNAFSVLSSLLVLNFLVAVFLFLPSRKIVSTAVLVVAAGATLFFVFTPQYQKAREQVYDQPVTETFFSPYGSLDVIGNSEDPEFFRKGRFLSGSLLPREKEEMLHPALQLHPRPERMLLVNAGPGLLAEALKYDSLTIDFVSPDAARIQLENKLLDNAPGASSDIRFIQKDPLRHLVHEETPAYDVVLIGGGIPATLAETRFYTLDFFDMVSQKLRAGGLIMTGGLPWMAAWSNSRGDILKVMHQTLREVFPHIRIWAGEKVFFLASHQNIQTEWWTYHADVLEGNQFFRKDFFPDYVLKDQTDQIREMVSEKARLNTQGQPVLFRLAIADLGDFWNLGIHWVVAVVVVMFLLALIVYRGSAGGVFLTGFVLGGMQVVLLLFWQMIMGDMYRATGLLFSLMMAGLALGAYLSRLKVFVFRPRFFPVMMFLLAFLSIGAVPLLESMGRVALFPLFTGLVVLLLAVAGGSIFASGVALQEGSVRKGAAIIYSADVAGGALGSFLIAIFFVPFSGLVNTGYLLGLMLLIGGLMHLKRL